MIIINIIINIIIIIFIINAITNVMNLSILLLISPRLRRNLPSINWRGGFALDVLLFNIIISYTDLLDARFIGDISWVWVFAFGLFAMTWILVTVYMKRAAKFDEMAEDTLREFHYGEEESR